MCLHLQLIFNKLLKIEILARFTSIYTRNCEGNILHQWKKGVIRASLDRLPFFLCLLQDNPEPFISLKSLEGL